MNSGLEIIAIRCNQKNCTGRKNLKIKKVYYLQKGYKIEDDLITITTNETISPILYNDYLATSPETPTIHISAIVGKNGSGISENPILNL